MSGKEPAQDKCKPRSVGTSSREALNRELWSRLEKGRVSPPDRGSLGGEVCDAFVAGTAVAIQTLPLSFFHPVRFSIQPGTSQILLKERERPCLSSRPTNRALDLTIAFDRPRRKSGWSPILPAVAQNKPTVDRLLKSDLEIAFQDSSGFHTHIFW